MRSRRVIKLSVALLGAIPTASVFAAPIAGAAPPQVGMFTTCPVGAYRSASSDVVVMMRLGRYAFTDGRWDTSNGNNPQAYCNAGTVYVKQADGTIDAWQPVPLRITRSHFVSNGTTLLGMLVEPVNAVGKPPLLVHAGPGSNNHGWVNGEWADGGHFPYLFAAHGISTFIYDKHGTGGSAGTFHMNFGRLADDLVAASREARRLADGRFGRVGLYGTSQGGWVVPLAAKEADADFMVINSAGVFSPLEEDAGEVMNGLREKGYGQDVLAKARQLVEAAHKLRVSRFQSGFEEMARLKKLYADEKWFGQIQGDLTTPILTSTEAELRARAGDPNPLEIDWDYDSTKTLRGLAVPTLWLLAGKDREAPGQLTEARLATLQREGKPIDVATFPNTDHGLLEFTEAADGRRAYIRAAEGSNRLVVDWIKGRFSPPYGEAVIQKAKP